VVFSNENIARLSRTARWAWEIRKWIPLMRTLALLSVVSMPVVAQMQELHGRVIAQAEKEPMVHIAIKVYSVFTNGRPAELLGGFQTETDGSFRVYGIEVSPVLVRITYPGYKQFERIISWNDTTVLSRTFGLEHEPHWYFDGCYYHTPPLNFKSANVTVTYSQEEITNFAGWK
jgi:hypothetical protein